MSLILVTGGTGTVGRHVVRGLAAANAEPRVLSRKAAPVWPMGAEWSTGDLSTGQGVERAVKGVDTVVHCATGYTRRFQDLGATANLITAAAEAGVRHLVYISIVGIDRVPFGYYRTKLAVEGLIEESGIGHTILRTTQFHELVDMIAGYLERPPVVAVPGGVSLQPVAARDAAERLVEIARGAPQGRAADMGGPEVRTVRDLVESHMDAGGVRRRIVELPVPGTVGDSLASGALLTPENSDGRTTWEQYLTHQARHHDD